MADTIYNWPVLLDPPGAVDAGNNSYRLPNGQVVARSILTTVAHVSEYPSDSRYGPGASIYSDGTVRRPDLSIIEDLRLSGISVSLGGINNATGKPYTTNDTPRNPDGSPFQWGRPQALAAAGVAPAVAIAYDKAGIDILASPIPINSGNPITFGPYTGLFPDAQGGTTLLDAYGKVKVTGFDYGLYFKRYSPVQYDANGMQISAVTTPEYRTYADDTVSMAEKPVTDAAGWSPTFDAAPPSTTGGIPILPAPAPVNLTGISGDVGDAAPALVQPSARGADWWAENRKMLLAIGIVVVIIASMKKGGK